MASIPMRCVAQNSKSRTGSVTTTLSQLRISQHGQWQLNPAWTTAFSFRSCTSSQRAFLGGIRCFSSKVAACTTECRSRQLSIADARWDTGHSWQASSKASRRRFSLYPKRSAQSQPSDQNNKLKDEPSSSLTLGSKIAAPKILKQALTPHENIYTLPNFLTFTRLLAAPAIGYFIVTSQPVAALTLFFYAGVTDLVDGYLARRFNSQTVVGTIIDPMADKTLMTVAVICLGIQGHIPVWLAVIILGRDVGLAISACYYRYISLPPPKTFARYWDFSLPSAEVRPTEISKINTLLQLLLVGNAMALPVLPTALVDAWNLVGVFEGWQVLVAGTTVWSGLSYVFSNDAVKILSQEEAKRKELEIKRGGRPAS